MTIDNQTARQNKRILRDADRLNALYNLLVLDTPYSADIDRLTMLAIEALEVQCAYIALVDLDRIFIKSYHRVDGHILLENDYPVDELANVLSQQAVIQGIPVAISDSSKLENPPSTIVGNAYVSALAVPLRLNDGHAIGALVTCDRKVREWSQREKSLLTHLAMSVVNDFELRSDIITHHRNEARLWSYSQELEVLNAELDAYGHTIAHDLKDPLNTVLGYASLIDFQSRELPEQEIRPYAHKIMALCDSMTLMIDQLLSLATLRDSNVVTEPINVHDIVRNVLIRFEHRLTAANAKVLVEGDLYNVMGHRAWLSEVFANLIANALNYNDPEKEQIIVTIRSRLIEEHVRYEINDNGVGIKPEDVDKLFVKFSRLKNSRNVSGTGIGLSIVANIINRLEGEIGVESEIGVGSTFWFTLPAI